MVGRVINKISEENIWIGGVYALERVEYLNRAGVTHVVSVMNGIENVDELSGIIGLDVEIVVEDDEGKREKDRDGDRKQTKARKKQLKLKSHLLIPVDDIDDENLLDHFPKANSFISRAVSSGGGVLIHCAMGISRSATVLLAYLMSTRGYSPSEALTYLRLFRPIVEPNMGFMEQLVVYHQTECAALLDGHPRYQRWLWLREVEMSNFVGRAPEVIRFVDEGVGVESSSSGGGGGEGSSGSGGVAMAVTATTTTIIDTTPTSTTPKNEEIELRCRKCRNKLANSKGFSPPHKTNHPPPPPFQKPTTGTPPPPTQPCAHHFLEPLLWMKPELSKGSLSGKLECPKCTCKVGNYAWQGIQCSCGVWVVPGISIARAKVDEIRVNLQPKM